MASTVKRGYVPTLGAKKIGASSYLSRAAQAESAKNVFASEDARASYVKEDVAQNNGGILGGLGYVAEKVGLGFLSGLEGIWDYTAGGIADLFGADEWAEEQFDNDWVNYNHADEWYNPSDGWKFAGDIAGGIGTSLPAIGGAVAGAAITYFSGGTAAPLGMKILAASLAPSAAGLAAAGNATKEAYRETGELGAAEYGYGAMVGATEAALEKVSGLLGTGGGRIVNAIGKKAAHETGEAVVKSSARYGFKSLISDFGWEAFEEGAAEILSPFYARATYDPDAKNATAGEVAYAALVGGLSGVVMGGATATAQTGFDFYAGHSSVQNGTAEQQMKAAERLIQYEQKNKTGYEVYGEIADAYGKLQATLPSTGGKVTTVEQKMLLGRIKRNIAVAPIMPFIERNAINAVVSAEAIAERYNTFGMTDATTGKPIEVSAEAIRKGVDMSLMQSNPKEFRKQLNKAIFENPVLSTVAIAGTAGQLTADIQKMQTAATGSTVDFTQQDFDALLRDSTEGRKQEIGRMLGIENMDAVRVEEFNQRKRKFVENGGVEAYREQVKSARAMRKVKKESAAALPESLPANLSDGAHRFASADGTVDLGIYKNGDTYFLYDHKTRNVSKALSAGQVEDILKGQAAELAERANRSAETAENAESEKHTDGKAGKTEDNKKAVTRTKKENVQVTDGMKEGLQKTTEKSNPSAKKYSYKDVLMLARDQIADYKTLDAPGQSTVRMTLRQALAHGMSEQDALMYARVSAHTGIRVVFDKMALARDEETQELVYADGFYNPRTNEIVVNPEGKRSAEALLVHELTHAIYRTVDGRLILEREVRNLSEAEKQKITKRYVRVGQRNSLILMDEMNAHYAEGLLANKNTLARLLDKKPTLSDRILSFFRSAKQDYAQDKRLSRSAEKLLRHYKTLFDNFSAQNRANLGMEAIRVEDGGEDTRFAIKYPTFSEADISSNMDAIADMEAVATIDASKLEKTGKKPFDLFFEYFESLGNNISTEIFGDVALNRVSVKSEIRHGITAEKIATIEAIPAVVKNGRVIFSKTKTGTDVERIIVAAPIKIGESDYYMGVMLQRDTQNQRLYLHNIVAVKTEEATLPSQDDSLTNWSDEGDSRLFITSILQKAVNVKVEKQKTTKKPAGISSSIDKEYLSAVEHGDLDTAQKMVDGAAKKAGYSTKRLYHGSSELFSVFDYGKIGSSTGVGILGEGFYFTDNKKLGKRYGDNLYEVYLKLQSPYEAKADDAYKLKSDELQKQGYDGVILKAPKGSVYMVFENTQIKSADPVTYDGDGNIIPLSKRFDDTYPDMRFALPEEGGVSYAELMSLENVTAFDPAAVLAKGAPREVRQAAVSVGGLKKALANARDSRVYNKKDALAIVERFEGVDFLTMKARDEIADMLWQGLHDCRDNAARKVFARDMAEFFVAKVFTEAREPDPDAQEAQARLDYLGKYIGSVAFSDEDVSEIRHTLDESGLKRIRGRWGYKGKAQKVSLDSFVSAFAREYPGMQHLAEMHPTEALYEIDELYLDARSRAKDTVSFFADIPDSELYGMVANIEGDILRAFHGAGQTSRFSKAVAENISHYTERAKFWRAEHDNIRGRDRLLGVLVNDAMKMRNLKLGTFANSTQADSEVFKTSIYKLSRVQFRGNVLNVTSIRKILSELSLWYQKTNPILEYVDEKSPGYYYQGIADTMDELIRGKGGFTNEDLKTLHGLMSYFTHFVETWGKVYRRGKWVDAKPEAERYVHTLHENESISLGPLNIKAGQAYLQTFGDPMTVARRMDKYERGFFTEMMEELRDGAVDAQVAEMELLLPYDAFVEKHSKYVESAMRETVEYNGVQIPRMHLIGVYMTAKRKHAWLGLLKNGFAFINAEGKRVRVGGTVDPEARLSEGELATEVARLQKSLSDLLTDTDREYISILERAYNEDARRLKTERDMQRLGYTNATSDYYYPIRRGNIAKNVDATDIAGEIDRVSNSSFNKNTVEGAQQELFIESADAVFRHHVHVVCQYAYLSPAIEAYNHLYNMDISGNKNKPVSVSTESANTWAEGNKYFVKLIADIQGVPASSSEGAKLLGKVRGSYAKFQLGANPKVWFTQLSSVFASSSLLDADAIARGFALDAKGLDEYCSLAKLRNYDNAAAAAQGVLDTRMKRAARGVEKFSDALMIPIGKMDRFVVSRLFGACQAQVEKDGGAKIGTSENKTAAGDLLRRVILETQQNSVATERSAAMRSGSETLRAVTMFSADSMKVIGRVIDGVGEVAALGSRLKAATDPEVKADLKKRLKEAGKRRNKAVMAMALSAAFMVGVAELFRWLYNKDKDEDEKDWQRMLTDFIGNLFGGLPVVRDVYSFFVDGYDVENPTYSVANDLLTSARGLFDAASDLFSGEGWSAEKNRALRNVARATAQVLGLPTRNVYNVLYGLTKRINPNTAYAIDAFFYEKNYQSDLYKAVEDGDDSRVSYIMGLLLSERMDSGTDKAVTAELVRLSNSGEKVLPRSIPDKCTIEGEEYELTAEEQSAAKTVMSEAESALASLFVRSEYKNLSDEDKAYAVNSVYDAYYDRAMAPITGKGERAVLLSKLLPVDAVAVLSTMTRGIEADKDKDGKTLAGSKRKKVVAAIRTMNVSLQERLLLICAKGYTIQDGDIPGYTAVRAKRLLLSYILSARGLSKAEKEKIAKMCGFEVKNGKIMQASLH